MGLTKEISPGAPLSSVGIVLIPMVQPIAQGGDLGLAKLLPLVGR